MSKKKHAKKVEKASPGGKTSTTCDQALTKNGNKEKASTGKDVAAGAVGVFVEHGLKAAGCPDTMAEVAGSAAAAGSRKVLENPRKALEALDERSKKAAPYAWEIVDIV
jgi:hypothetical protein